jgi:hypothetical protein
MVGLFRVGVVTPAGKFAVKSLIRLGVALTGGPGIIVNSDPVAIKYDNTQTSKHSDKEGNGICSGRDVLIV